VPVLICFQTFRFQPLSKLNTRYIDPPFNLSSYSENDHRKKEEPKTADEPVKNRTSMWIQASNSHQKILQAQAEKHNAEYMYQVEWKRNLSEVLTKVRLKKTLEPRKLRDGEK